MTNEVFDFSSLFQRKGDVLADQVFHAKSIDERISLLSDFISKRTVSHSVDPISCFVDHVIRSNGQIEVSKLQQDSGLSVKQFERRFKAVSGFTPKYFSRIVRFQGIKSNHAAIGSNTLTSLAYTGNYYDQSHFNKEFKEFSGVQPLQYFRLMNMEYPSSENFFNDSGTHCFKGYLPCGWFV